MGVSSARANQKKTESNRASSSGWRIYFVLIVVCLFGGMAARSLFFPPQQEQQQEASQKPPEPPTAGGKLPSFTLMPMGQSLLTGQAYTNQSLEGHKTVFVIVKATCPHCIKECTWLSTYLPNLKGRATLVVASISSAPETAQFAAATGLSEGMYMNGGPLALEAGIQAVPDLFLLDETGTIRYFHQGELDSEKLKSVLETFLQGGDPSQIALQTENLQGRKIS
jgi:Redoxin